MNDPLIGQQLANFRIEHLLGRGGMAQVYYGWDVKLHRPVAVKVIDARYRDNPAYARRFVKEARVLAKWHHEHIIQIYYTDDEDGLYYYAMEYVDGENLATLMTSYAFDGELMPIEDVLRIGKAVASALDYAHAQGVVHRDVKPSNILVARDERVVLGDFGLALDLHDGSLGEAFGTPHYISPEQASRSANAVPQSDLYSLGVILYEMLTGVVPFSDPSPTSVALQHITDPPPSPRSNNPNLNAEVEAVLLKALEKSPQKRYQTGADLLAALKNALTPNSKLAAPPLPPLPVDVPTIARRIVSKQSVTERVASRPRSEFAPTVRINDEIEPAVIGRREKASSRKRLSKLIWGGLLGLVILVVFAYGSANGMFGFSLPSQIISFSSTPTRTHTPTVVDSPTSFPTSTYVFFTTTVLIPLDTATTTFTNTAQPTNTKPPTAISTLTSTPTSTYTSIHVETGTSTYTTATTSVLATPSLTPTYGPAIYRFLLYYNENSFYIRNSSKVTRSSSGFSFEQLDDQENIIESFGGWRWERYFTNKIFPNRCMAIEIYLGSPFLKPPECPVPYLSLVNPARDTDMIFWTTKENSHQFRVLWQGEEFGRCDTDAGECEVFVP